MNADPRKSGFGAPGKPGGPLDSVRRWIEPALKVSDQPMDPDLERRLRRPMVTGAVLIGVFVVGLLGWAIVAPLDSAVIAPGVVRVEENRKIIRHREGGIVRAILVREGQKVKKDQVLLTMDDVQPRAAADVMQNQVDTYAAQVARFEAEASGARQIAFPAELTARIQQRLAQQKGEAQVQLAALSDQRISQSAEGLRQMQAALADARPKLASALQTLAGATVRAPVDGYVLNLTQSTVGGVVGQGELLMAVVPSDAPLAVTARIKPDEIEGISAGMKARVTITAFSTRRVSPFDAVVTNVSADELTDEKSGQSYYRADLKIDPKELTKLPRGETVTPGMPAQVMITTGRRTVMGYIVGPLTDTVNASMRDK